MYATCLWSVIFGWCTFGISGRSVFVLLSYSEQIMLGIAALNLEDAKGIKPMFSVMVGHAHTCLKIAWSPTMARAHRVTSYLFSLSHTSTHQSKTTQLTYA